MTDRLVETLLPAHPVLPGPDRSAVAHDVVRFTRAQLRAMPQPLGFLLGLALLAFDLTACLRFGRPFRSLAAPARARWVAMWDRGPLRDVLKPVRTCVLLAWYDHPLVQEVLLEP